MGFGETHRMVRLLMKLMEGDPSPAILPMRVQKVPFRACKAESDALPRARPEEVGVDPDSLLRFLRAAAEDREENLHSLTVLRHGKVIAEKSFTPYDRTVWHATHSLCKTVTALAVGILIGDGKLSLQERVTDIFADRCTPMMKRRYEKLNVFHLLTMTSGASFSEPQSVTETDWVHGFLRSQPLFPAGERFHYNSMNTYMLSAIVYRKTGKTLRAFLEERLFRQMGIRRFCWETCPCSIEKGGWGLYLLQEDAAKLGQLLLNRGRWNGEQLVPKDFITGMCFWHSDPPKSLSQNGYGYQCWLWERAGSVQLSGLFGQTVLVVPDLDMVVAANAGAGRLIGKSAFERHCAVFFEEIELGCHVKVNNYTDVLTGNMPQMQKNVYVPCALRSVECFRVQSGFARLLPVFMQLLENVYTTGIDRVCFMRKGTVLYMTVSEGAVRNTLQVGFLTPARGEIVVYGEVYLVSVLGRWEREGENAKLHTEIAFLEQASTRYMDFLFSGDGSLSVHLSEKPGKDALVTGAGLLFSETGRNPFETRFMRTRLQKLAEPELYCVRE